MPMLDTLNSRSKMTASTGEDCRNYGMADGLPELRLLFAEMMGVDDHNIIVGGNSSLNMMFDVISCAMTHGFSDCEPWMHQGHLKFLCPSPGYDRHFAITEYFGMELIPIEMTPEGPNMDEVERWVNNDPQVKGIWCVPKYSNPQGYTYSDETVRRFAALKPAAKDFRIFWDNAYCVHDLTDTPDQLLNLWHECRKTHNIDLPIFFASTSKITFPGAGVAAVGASEVNLAILRTHYSYQTIGPGQAQPAPPHLFPARYGRRPRRRCGGTARSSRRNSRRCFRQAGGTSWGARAMAEWTKPNGGYFVSVQVTGRLRQARRAAVQGGRRAADGCGGRVSLRQGSQRDSNIRVAPTYPPVSELEVAMDLFCLCTKLAAVEKLLETK